MIPTLSSDQLTAIRALTARLVFLVELELDSGTQRVCSAIRDVKWGGETWGGLGRLTKIDVIEEKTNLEAVAVRLSLSGVPLSWRSLALQEPIRGRQCNVYVGIFDGDEKPIGDVLLEYGGLLDAPEIATSEPDAMTGEQVAEISITVEGILIDFARGGRGRRHTHEDQQELHPGDTFYKRADDISKKVFPWGVPK